MSVRDAAEALIDAEDNLTRHLAETGNVLKELVDKHDEAFDALREALAKPEPVTVDDLLVAMRRTPVTGNPGEIGERAWLCIDGNGQLVLTAPRFEATPVQYDNETEADAIMRVLREQASEDQGDGDGD